MKAWLVRIAAGVGALFALLLYLARRNNPRLFAPFVRGYARDDARLGVTTCDTVLTGSSVMKFWESYERDLAPYPVINRAIPGTKIGEIAYHAGALVSKYHPKRVFLYAGSNDISAPMPRTAAQVLEGFEEFVAEVRRADARVKIYYISIIIAPSPMRLPHRAAIEAANAAIRDYCRRGEGLYFIDIVPDFLDGDGSPRRELFVPDQIHLQPEAYGVWRDKIRACIAEDVG